MVITTRKQREALKRKFDVCPIYKGGSAATEIASKAGWTYVQDDEHGWVWTHPNRKAMFHDAADVVAEYKLATPIAYRDFRKLVQPTFGCDGSVMVPWCGMWLGIEKDGYTHS